MRNVLLGVAVSLDGYIEGPHGEYDWCLADQDYGMAEFLDRVDALFLGRKSYEVFASQETPAGSDPFAAQKKYVFSNSLREVREGLELVSGDLKTAVTALKNEPGKDIWLFGGAELTASFLDAGLVDELFLAVHPLILGGGKRLFADRPDRLPLTLTDTKTYSTGLVSLYYRLNSR